ncbi:SAM-dependent methyltransferase [Streptomyces sp. NPDC059373]
MDSTRSVIGSGGYHPSQIRTDRPQPARMYDYYLGGKDNYEVDQIAAERVLEVFPDVAKTARANRAFLHRAVRFLAEEAQIDQFLDIGTGIPGEGNTHEVAQAGIPHARVAYVDNDPIVLTHARARLRSGESGAVAYIDADLRDPAAILRAPELAGVLDLDRPVALLLMAVLHFIEDSDDPYGVVDSLLRALPPGSYLALSHVTGDYAPETWGQIVRMYRENGMSAQVRSRPEVQRFFASVEMVSPGLEVVSRWRPGEDRVELTDRAVSCYGAVARVR